MASREANSLECRQLIADFVNHEQEMMLGLFYRSVRVIEEALDARREYTTREAKCCRAVRITTRDWLPLSTCATS